MRSVERFGMVGASVAIVLGTAACQSEAPMPVRTTSTPATSKPSSTPAPTTTTTERTMPPIVYSRKLDAVKDDISEIGIFHIFDDDTGMFDATIKTQLTDVRSTVLNIRCEDDGSIRGTATTSVDYLGEATKTNQPENHKNKRVTVTPDLVSENQFCENLRLNSSSDLGKLAIILMQQSVLKQGSSTNNGLI